MVSCEQSEALVELAQNAHEQSQQLLNLATNADKQSHQLVTLATKADQQSKENARQERILMLFTLFTIVFVGILCRICFLSDS
jgi:hypothetical protein